MSKYKLDKLAQIVENSNYIMTQEEVCERLNQQSERILDIEEQLNNSEQKCFICNKDQENEQLKKYITELEEQLKKSLESNNDLLKQTMELQSQLIIERLKGEKK